METVDAFPSYIMLMAILIYSIRNTHNEQLRKSVLVYRPKSGYTGYG